MNNYAHIFDILIKLRQAVDHPYLVIYSNNNKNTQTQSQSQSQLITNQSIKAIIDTTEVSIMCDICEDIIEDGQLCQSKQCNHMFCKDCIMNYINTNTNEINKCPKCNKLLTIDLEATTTIDQSYNTSMTKGAGNKNRNGLIMLSGKKKSIVDKIDLNMFQSSTKMEALMQVS